MVTQDLTDAELAARLRLALARITRRLRQHTPQSLSSSQVSTLASVEELEPVRLSDLAVVEGVSLPTQSRVVASLERHRLLVRKPDPDDGRAAQLHITAQGRERLEQLRTERSAFLVERLGTLTEAQRAALTDALDALETLAKGERA
ncbi:MarR family winged helix-turn-helix transcriptional regulator [Actinomadura scrupuli]|uniref:MarR family winged helix-turn-helix transcriptional regulator n=1 Tax=Actinomadura scrupuli TaxID=559629 RepID=UPI003D956C0E